MSILTGCDIMHFYLINPLPPAFTKKMEFEFAMRTANVVLIIDGHLSVSKSVKRQHLSGIPDLLICSPSVVQLSQLNKYIIDLTEYSLSNGYTMPNDLIFIVVPENEYSQHVDNFITSNTYTFLILNYISYSTKAKFKNYQPKIVYE